MELDGEVAANYLCNEEERITRAVCELLYEGSLRSRLAKAMPLVLMVNVDALPDERLRAEWQEVHLEVNRQQHADGSTRLNGDAISGLEDWLVAQTPERLGHVAEQILITRDRICEAQWIALRWADVKIDPSLESEISKSLGDLIGREPTEGEPTE